jgi:hypothetical protein
LALRDNLKAMGVKVVADRVVWQGNHISGAGNVREHASAVVRLVRAHAITVVGAREVHHTAAIRS